MYFLSWGKRRKSSRLEEVFISPRGGVHPCSTEDLWVYNNWERTGAEHPATELNEAQWQAVQVRKEWLTANGYSFDVVAL